MDWMPTWTSPIAGINMPQNHSQPMARVGVKHRKLHRPKHLADIPQVGNQRVGDPFAGGETGRNSASFPLDHKGGDARGRAQGEEGKLFQNQTKRLSEGRTPNWIRGVIEWGGSVWPRAPRFP